MDERGVPGDHAARLPGASLDPIGFSVSNQGPSGGGPVVYISSDAAWGKLLFTLTNNTEVIGLTTSSVLTIYLDSLLTDAEIAAITLLSGEWTGGPVTDDLGTHLEFMPAQPITFRTSTSLTIEVSGALASGMATPGYFMFAYANFDGVADGETSLNGFRQAPPLSRKPWLLSLAWAPRDAYNATGNTVYTTPWSLQSSEGIDNTFILQILNDNSEVLPFPTKSTPSLQISFVPGSGQNALCSSDHLKHVDCAIWQSDTGGAWLVNKDTSGPHPIFTLTPDPSNTELFVGGGILALAFSGLVTQLASGFASNVFVQFAGLPGYDDGYLWAILNKVDPVPYLVSFSVTASGVNPTPGQEVPNGPVSVGWSVFAAQTCRFGADTTPMKAADSITFSPSGPYPETIECAVMPYIGTQAHPNAGSSLAFSMAAPVTVSMSAWWEVHKGPGKLRPPRMLKCSWTSANATICSVKWYGREIDTQLSGSWQENFTYESRQSFTIDVFGALGEHASHAATATPQESQT